MRLDLPDWMTDGACREVPPRLMFPTGPADSAKGQQVCARCTVRAECLEYALVNRIDHGTWGGANERERRRLHRRLTAA